MEAVASILTIETRIWMIKKPFLCVHSCSGIVQTLKEYGNSLVKEDKLSVIRWVSSGDLMYGDYNYMVTIINNTVLNSLE